MITKQPKIIKVKKASDPLLKHLPEGPIECKLQDRDPEDTSKVVYVSNPSYVKDSKDSMKGSPYIALTSYEYEVVEWFDPEEKKITKKVGRPKKSS